MVLDDLGLIPALSRYIEDFKTGFIDVKLVASQNIRLPNTLGWQSIGLSGGLTKC